MSSMRIKIITRGSSLALQQVKEIMIHFPGIDASVTTRDSYGDKHKNISLLSGVPSDFFTRELDQILLSGKADIAIHSAKDLPVPIPEGLELIALTKALDQSDALVSISKKGLKTLKAGSVVGTSSLTRKAQLLALRPDIIIKAVRGTIEERLKLLDDGKLDALIAASCALKRLGLSSRITEILPFETHPLQGMLAVVAKEGRPDLKVLFSKIDVRNTYGKAYIVGAGAGAKDLLTIRASKIISAADTIFYDDLIDEEIINESRAAKKIYVGKRKGRHSYSQSEINEAIYQAARKPRVVVRLKGGDPFIFGRGGEEVKYLTDRWINVEVVPGITAAQAGASSSCIPLTMRGLVGELTFLSGHSATGSAAAAIYMASSTPAEASQLLKKRGFTQDAPVAAIYHAGFPDEEIKLTDVSNLAKEQIVSPSIILAGKTAGMYFKLPKVLYTGIEPYRCLAWGKIIHYPLIDIKPVKFNIALSRHDAIVFTSKNAVHVFFGRYQPLAAQAIISIGSSTTKAIEDHGYIANIQSSIPDSDELAKIIRAGKFKKILYPCSSLSDNTLHYMKGIEPVKVYKTVAKLQPRLDLNKFSGIVFTSPSTVDAFIAMYGKIPRRHVLYVYGKHTQHALNKKGYSKNVQTVSLPQGN